LCGSFFFEKVLSSKFNFCCLLLLLLLLLLPLLLLLLPLAIISILKFTTEIIQNIYYGKLISDGQLLVTV